MNRILTLLLALVAATGMAQTPESSDSTAQKEKIKNPVILSGHVADSFTKAAIPDVFVSLMRPDSSVVDTMHVWNYGGWAWGIGKTKSQTGYSFLIRRESADYILRFEHPNYETTYADAHVGNVGRRRESIDGPSVYLKKAARSDHFSGGVLGEVEIKATKVKMVWKGDTLVYNADAFNVPEGSMLDGLIKQLPGVELNDAGEIFVNGKKIDNLTLNGADFFKGKNKIMLENLPYYTVKNIEVYNKQTPENKYYGIDDEDKKEYTMDVVLKREYSIGGTANLEAGYGTEDRYKLKGFGLRYSDHTRAVLYGGANNINESASFQQTSERYTDRSHQAGDRHFKQVGGMFTYLGSEGRLNNSTEVNAEWQDDTGETRTNGETFLNGASTFSLSASSNRSKPVNVGLRNTFQFTGPLYIYARTQLDYRRSNFESEGWSLSTADAQHTDSVNSTLYRSHSQSDRLSGTISGNTGKRLASGDNLSMNFFGNFGRTFSPEAFSLSDYTYYRLGTSQRKDRRTLSPAYNYNYKFTFTYDYNLTKHFSVSPFYGIGYSRDHNEREEYLRDSIDYVLDAANSYGSGAQHLVHETGASFRYSKISENMAYLHISGQMKVDFERQELSYDQQTTTRRYTNLRPTFSLMYQTDKGVRQVMLTYYPSVSTPSATDLLSRPDTSDPLYIYLGNENLKKSMSHRLSASYAVRRDSIGQTLRFELDGGLTHNAISRGYNYDLTTGVRTYRPENIASGNWNVNGTVVWNRNLDREKIWTMGNEVRVGFTRSTGLANVQGSQASELSRVDNITVRYKPNVRYQKGNLTLRVKGEAQYRNIRRSLYILDALPTDIWDFSYGVYGQYKFPLSFTLETDLSMHSRRGYSDSEMNDNRLYWDATLTKGFQKNRWVLKLRGYDILHQVSNLRYSVNAQGRTETWNNTLRRYAMLSVSYRFSQKPKKK